MQVYETTFILSPQADDATFDRQINAVSELIKRYDGKLLHEDRWGIRRLAYPIKKFTQGYFTRLLFEGSSKVLSELERHYKIEEPYLRYLTVLHDSEMEERLSKDKKPFHARTERRPSREREAPKEIPAKPEIPAEPETPEPDVKPEMGEQEKSPEQGQPTPESGASTEENN
jgi:small subunit ribosomal protein S6